MQPKKIKYTGKNLQINKEQVSVTRRVITKRSENNRKKLSKTNWKRKSLNPKKITHWATVRKQTIFLVNRNIFSLKNSYLNKKNALLHS